MILGLEIILALNLPLFGNNVSTIDFYELLQENTSLVPKCKSATHFKSVLELVVIEKSSNFSIWLKVLYCI